MEQHWSAHSHHTVRHDVLGAGITNVDGTEWYFPQRLTDDTAAVANGNPNPAQKRARRRFHPGPQPPTESAASTPSLPISAERECSVDARVLAQQSGIPMSHLILIDEQSTYAHNDPAGAYPTNIFFNHLVPFLKKV